jgi:YHS domain-containing protein
MAMDLVCNMEVDEATAQWTSEYKGQTYYFCAPGCKKSFDDDPEKYGSESGSHEGHMDHDHEGHEAHEGHMDHDHSDH